MQTDPPLPPPSQEPPQPHCDDAPINEVRTRVRFKSDRVAHGAQCESETQLAICGEDGKWGPFSGSFSFEDCFRNCPKAAHGETWEEIRYAEHNVSDLNSCQEEHIAKSCYDGEVRSEPASFRYPVCTTLENISIELDDIAKDRILGAIQRSQETGIYIKEDRDLFPVWLVHNGKRYQGEGRFKGDWLDHADDLASSLRIKLPEPLLGMTEFSIQKIETRSNYELPMKEYMRSLGLAAPRYRYINYSINGAFVNVRAMEEHFNANTTVGMKRKEGILFAPDENSYWAQRAACVLYEKRTSSTCELSSYTPHVRTYDSSTIKTSSYKYSLFNDAFGSFLGHRQGLLPISQVFDEEHNARMLAIARLFSAYHGSAGGTWHNRTFYFNPLSKLIEILAFDESPDGISAEAKLTDVFHSEKALNAFSEQLKLMKSQADSGDLLWILDDLRSRLYANFAKVPENVAYGIEAAATKLNALVDLLPTRSCCEFNVIDIEPYIDSADPAHPFATPLYAFYIPNGEEGGELELQNGTGRLVSVTKIELRTKNHVDWEAQRNISVFPNIARSNLAKLSVPRLADRSKQHYRVYFTVQSQPELRFAKAAMWAEARTTPLLPYSEREAWKAEYPQFHVDEEARIISLTAGSYSFEKTLSLPDEYSLHLAAGVTLAFAPSAQLLVHNNVLFEGSPEHPVRLLALDAKKGWGGMVVYGKEALSIIKHTEFSGISIAPETSRGMSSAVTLYKGSAQITDSSWTHITASAALHIFKMDASLHNLYLSNEGETGLLLEHTNGTADHLRMEKSHTGLSMYNGRFLLSHSNFFKNSSGAISLAGDARLRAALLNVEETHNGATLTGAAHLYLENSDLVNVTGPVFSGPKKPQNETSCEVRFYDLRTESKDADLRADSCSITALPAARPFKMLLAGNAIGAQDGQSYLPHLPLRTVLKAPEHQDSDAIAFLGNLVRNSDKINYLSSKQFLQDTTQQWFLAPGQNEAQNWLNYERYAGRNRYRAFLYNDSLFLFLDLNHDGWTVDPIQLAWLEELLQKYNSAFNHMHVFTHQLWWTVSAPERIPLTPVITNACYKGNTFWRRIIPLFQSDKILSDCSGSSGKHSFWGDVLPLLRKERKGINFYAGDVGAAGASPSFYEAQHEELHFFAAGMGKSSERNEASKAATGTYLMIEAVPEHTEVKALAL